MQFICSSKFAKRKAKLLRKALEKRERGISYIKCLELTARLFGFRNYHEFARIEGSAEKSPFDDFVDDAMLEARFCTQEEVMATAGFADIAGELLDEVNPTGGFFPPSCIPSESQHSTNSESQLPSQLLVSAHERNEEVRSINHLNVRRSTTNVIEE
jgi:hypothetical protein